jgi:hypothetical protein
MKNKKQTVAVLSGSIVSFLLFAAPVAQALPDVEISTGYNDEPRNGTPYSDGSGQPSPWYGSANTTFYGSVGTAAAYDPDEDAILLQNLGGTSISLTAANIGAYNLFTLNSIGTAVTIAPGQDVILAGVDGSDAFSGLQTVGVTLDGIAYNFSDVTTTEAPGGVLDGASPWIGGAESIPWTAIYTPPSSVPDNGPGLILTAATLLGVCIFSRKLSRPSVA